jgi:hypothetical protein
VSFLPFVLALVLVAAAGGFVGFVIARQQLQTKQKPKRRDFLIVYDGQEWTVNPSRPDPEGGYSIMLDQGIGKDYLIPEGFLQRSLAIDEVTQVHFLFFADRLALRTHEQLDNYRRAVLARSAPAYKPGGDSLGLVRMVTVALPILVSVYMVFQVMGMNDQMRALDAGVQTLNVLLKDGVRIDEGEQ